jgi:hypothetical protein
MSVQAARREMSLIYKLKVKSSLVFGHSHNAGVGRRRNHIKNQMQPYARFNYLLSTVIYRITLCFCSKTGIDAASG